MTGIPPHIYTPTSLTVVIDGVPYTSNEGQSTFKAAVDAFKQGHYSDIPGLCDVASAITQFAGHAGILVQDGEVSYWGEVLSGYAIDRILALQAEGFDIAPMAKFLENLMENPSKRAVDHLWAFMEKGSMPITSDGYFLAYKRVQEDYKDIHSGTVDYTPGNIVEQARNTVDEDPDRTCSHGLHACSLDYLQHFGGARTVIVKINPRDVVAIPRDYNDAKLRACLMEVVGEIENTTNGTKAFHHSVQDWGRDEFGYSEGAFYEENGYYDYDFD